jgi:ABC-2 type transport system permease protein
MRTLLEIWVLFKRKMLETIRQPVWVFMGLTTPLLYITLFSPLLGKLSDPPLDTGAVLDTFVPGVLTLLAFIGGTGAGYSVISELQNGVIERLRVSPASRFSLLMGTILRDIVAFLVPSILVIFIAQLFGFKAHISGLLVMLVLLSLLTAIVSAWSGSLGLILKQASSMAALVAGLELPLTLLSGVLLPLSLGPKWLQAIAHINPLYYAVEASRVLGAGIIGSPEVFKAFVVIVPLTVMTLLWATRVYHKAIS